LDVAATIESAVANYASAQYSAGDRSDSPYGL
jgi:hypothetical protein